MTNNFSNFKFEQYLRESWNIIYNLIFKIIHPTGTSSPYIKYIYYPYSKWTLSSWPSKLHQTLPPLAQLAPVDLSSSQPGRAEAFTRPNCSSSTHGYKARQFQPKLLQLSNKFWNQWTRSEVEWSPLTWHQLNQLQHQNASHSQYWWKIS